MVEAVITALIVLCVIAALVFLVIWVLGQLGVALPQRVIQILWVIVVLVAILFLWRAFGGALHIGNI